MEEHILTLHDDIIAQTLEHLQQTRRKIQKLAEEYHPTFSGERLLTDAELAEYLKVTRRTLQQYRSQRLMPYILLKGRVLYKESDIERMLEKYCQKVADK
ncbi:helix-turn-helix domain-containing protein [Prevotella nigrescens]